MKDNYNSNIGFIIFLGLLSGLSTVILIMLKIFKVINISWLFIVSPMIMALALFTLTIVIGYILTNLSE